MIILQVLAILIGIAYVTWDTYGVYVILFIIILLMYFVYRYIKEYNQINILKKRKNITQQELVLSIINQINKYKKILIYKDNIILIMSNGIFFIKVLDYSGQISGQINDNYLNKKEDSKLITIKNDLKNFDEEYIEINNKEIIKYVIIKNNCILNLKLNNDIKIIKFKNTYFTLSTGSNKYIEEEINDIYEKMNCQIMSKN